MKKLCIRRDYGALITNFFIIPFPFHFESSNINEGVETVDYKAHGWYWLFWIFIVVDVDDGTLKPAFHNIIGRKE